MNWFVSGRTKLKVGFGEDGNVCEGGNCEHLKEGDTAAGYSGEADSWGEERYLMCDPCYNAFMAARRVEPTECNDCQKEFPRNTLYRYIPYIMDGSPSENEDSKLWVCEDCQGKFRHLNRMENDRELRERDEEDDDRFDSQGFFDDDDNDDHEEDTLQMIEKGWFSHQTYHWSRRDLSNKVTRSKYSKCIETITVVDNTYHL